MGSFEPFVIRKGTFCWSSHCWSAQGWKRGCINLVFDLIVFIHCLMFWYFFFPIICIFIHLAGLCWRCLGHGIFSFWLGNILEAVKETLNHYSWIQWSYAEGSTTCCALWSLLNKSHMDFSLLNLIFSSWRRTCPLMSLLGSNEVLRNCDPKG